MAPVTMSGHVIVRHGISLGLVALAEVVVPALVAVGFLYFLVLAFDAQLEQYFNAMAVLVTVIMLLLPAQGRGERQPPWSGHLPLVLGVLARWAVLLAALLAIAYVTKLSGVYSRRVVLTWALVTPALLVPIAISLQAWTRRIMCRPQNARRTVIVGCNEVSRRLSRQLRSHSEYCLSVQGFFDDRGLDRLQLEPGERLLGRLTELAPWVKSNQVEVIFLALPVGHLPRVTTLLNDLRDTTASVYFAPDLLLYDLIQARTIWISDIPVIAMCETPIHGYRGLTKRLTDVIVAGAALVAMLPLLIGIGVMIKATSPGPVIFRQSRYGLNGEKIVVYKFRTMHVTEDGAEITQASRDDPRITRAGRFLRKYSLDELPQLINVLQGRMSLVGPRPHAVAHNEMYRKLINGYMVRHKVLPGITGLAQVNGLRGETQTLEQMEARVKCDLEYLRNWSVGLDLRILAQTALRVWNDRQAF